jgi:hypothetical protein
VLGGLSEHYTFIQGGSDISGTLSKLYSRIKKWLFFTNYFAETVSYVCPSVNKLNQTSSGKDVSTGKYKNRG